jgi:hypothetical protein
MWFRVFLKQLAIIQQTNFLFLWNLDVHHYLQRSLLLDYTPNQLNPVHNFTPYFFKIYFDTTLPSPYPKFSNQKFCGDFSFSLDLTIQIISGEEYKL